jgi:hypothetical protein
MAATGKTQPYQFPYPEDDNPVDVSGDIALLAEAVNNKIDGIIVDVVGLMVTNNNVETGISVIFDDTNSNIDFVLDLNYIKNNVATMFDHEDHIGVNAVYDTVNKQINLEVTGGGGSGGTGTSSLTTSWWLGV